VGSSVQQVADDDGQRVEQGEVRQAIEQRNAAERQRRPEHGRRSFIDSAEKEQGGPRASSADTAVTAVAWKAPSAVTSDTGRCISADSAIIAHPAAHSTSSSVIR
jgi:hypothetical protein